MKKYIKPELFYERFELSEHIADCAWELQQAENACYAIPDMQKIPGDDFLFTASVISGTCTVTPDVYGDICYHKNVAHANVHSS